MAENTGVERSRTAAALMVNNILLAVLLVAFAGAFLYVNYADLSTSDASMSAQYAEVAKERLSEHSEDIEREMMSLASETIPPIADAVVEQARRDYPKYVHVLKHQGKALVESLEQTFVREVKDQYREYLAAHREVLEREFPEHASEENVDRVMQDFQTVFDRIVERYYLDEFRRLAAETEKRWAAIDPLPMPGPGEPSLQEQLADYSSDWAVLAVADSGDAAQIDAHRPQTDAGQHQQPQ